MTEACPALAYICPNCAGDVLEGSSRFACRACGREYPILFGIPDFRTRPDRYLSLAEERAKAARLHEFGLNHSFAELLNFYYDITDDVPPHLARSFKDYVRSAPGRASLILSELGPIGTSPRLLDLGCGSGGMLVAAAPEYREMVGVDIGLRWLVICKKRLDEERIQATLVCADAERLPFAGGTFSHVIANDLLNHVRSPEAMLESAVAQLRPGGTLWVSANGRWWPGPDPAVGIWAIGLMPPPFRKWLARRKAGVDLLRNHTFVSPRHIAGVIKKQKLEIVEAGPRALPPGKVAQAKIAWKGLAVVYRWLARNAATRPLMFVFGPTFQIIARRNSGGKACVSG